MWRSVSELFGVPLSPDNRRGRTSPFARAESCSDYRGKYLYSAFELQPYSWRLTASGTRVTGAGPHTASHLFPACRQIPEVGAVCGKATRTGSVRGAHSNMCPYRDPQSPEAKPPKRQITKTGSQNRDALPLCACLRLHLNRPCEKIVRQADPPAWRRT